MLDTIKKALQELEQGSLYEKSRIYDGIKRNSGDWLQWSVEEIERQQEINKTFSQMYTEVSLKLTDKNNEIDAKDRLIQQQEEEIQRLKHENVALVRIGNQAYADGINAGLSTLEPKEGDTT